MIQVLFKRYDKKLLSTDNYFEDVAYFPTHKAALIIISLWSRGQFIYEIVKIDNVFVDLDQIHPDCEHYSHLI